MALHPSVIKFFEKRPSIICLSILGNCCDITFNLVSQLVDPKSFVEGYRGKKKIARYSARMFERFFASTKFSFDLQKIHSGLN